jgi:hypothetical protein
MLDARLCIRRTRAGEVIVRVPCGEELRVAPSRIPAAGEGLYAARAYGCGELIAVYTGTPLRTLGALRLPDKSYLMRLGPQCYIDAREHRGVLARYINDACDPARQNVVFEKHEEQRCALVIAARAIDEGEELYVDYGKWYWAARGRGNTPQ